MKPLRSKMGCQVSLVLVGILCFLGFTARLQGYDLKGQLISWVDYNYAGDNWVSNLGYRYFPDFSWETPLLGEATLDFNISAQAYLVHRSGQESQQNIELYRLKGRLVTEKSDLRVGLQKLNFGAAQILRPLKWFDQLDPQDASKITGGVYGIRYRYFFLNNANVWLWGLYGNEKPKGFEQTATAKDDPEFGGRVQIPVAEGEIGLTVHGRKVQGLGFMPSPVPADKHQELRYGLDGRFDVEIGFWFELAVMDQVVKPHPLRFVTMGMVGADYTVAWGNGVQILAEHMLSRMSASVFDASSAIHVSALQLSYPLDMAHSVGLILIKQWPDLPTGQVNWNVIYDDLIFSTGAFWSWSEKPPAPSATNKSALTRGVKVQILLNH